MIGVHDLHVWILADSMIIASLHIFISESNSDNVKHIVEQCKDVLHKFNIHSSTLQVELRSNGSDSEVCLETSISY